MRILGVGSESGIACTRSALFRKFSSVGLIKRQLVRSFELVRSGYYQASGCLLIDRPRN